MYKDCRKALTSDGSSSDPDPVVIGQVAHIRGKKPDSARYQSNMTDEDRDHYNNLIYLCPTCHTKIDKQPKEFSVQFLLSLRKEHETWADEQLDQGMSEFTFAELETAIKALVSDKHSSNNDTFLVITPEEKIKKNDLSDSVRKYIAMGLTRSHEVERFLANMATNIDEQYPERLKSSFRTEYLKLKETLSGDALFMSMLTFAQNGQSEFTQQAAGLAILSHLFHLCEVFEK